MTGWRKLRLTLGVVEDDGEGNEEKGETQREERVETGREVEKQVEKYREKGKKKGVTWADEAKGGCLEKMRIVSFEGPPPLVFVPGRHRKMCGEMLGWEIGDKERVKVECVGLDRDEDVVMKDVKDVVDEASEDVMPSNASEGSPNDLPPSFSPPPSISPPPYSTAPPPSSSSSSPTPSPVEVEVDSSHQQHSTTRDGDDLDFRADTDVCIPGWDSDLSNLSESDSSASETDSTTDSDSTDESDSDNTSTSTIPVTVRLPSPFFPFFSPTLLSFRSNHPQRDSKSAFVYPLRGLPRLSDFVHRGIVVRFWMLEMGMSINGRFVCYVGRGSGRGGG